MLFLPCLCDPNNIKYVVCSGLGLGFTNPVGTGGVLDVCLCLNCRGVGVGSVGGEWVVGLVQDLEGWCYVCVSFGLGGYLRILVMDSYGYLLYIVYLLLADIANPDLFVSGCRTWICLDITRFYDEQCQPSNGSVWPACLCR